MATSLNTYHKEYSCEMKKWNEQQVANYKPIKQKKAFWIIYGTLLLASLYIFPFWLSVLVYMTGILIMPTTNRIQVTDNPFLVVDMKYIQYCERVISWGSVDSIIVTQEVVRKKGRNCDLVVLFKSTLGKEFRVETVHFEKQEEIISEILFLAEKKGIHLRDERSKSVSSPSFDK